MKAGSLRSPLVELLQLASQAALALMALCEVPVEGDLMVRLEDLEVRLSWDATFRPSAEERAGRSCG